MNTASPEAAAPFVLWLVLLAAALHASWNAILKGTRGGLAALATMTAAGGLFCLLFIPFVPAPDRAAWPFLALSVLLHVGYYVFLVGSYRFGDLSHVYPIARGTGPIFVAVLSPWLVGDALRPVEIVAIVVISSGVVSLAIPAFRTVLFGSRSGAPGPAAATLCALATGLFIAAYTITDGLGVRAAGQAFSYILWMNFLEGLPLLLWFVIVRRREYTAHLRRGGRLAAFAGILAAIAYGLVVWAYSLGTIATIAALRETSVIIAAWIGTRMLGEPFGIRRIAAATVVALGIVLLHLP